MNLHKNARTCPKSRALMVSRVLEGHRPVASVAEEFGVSSWNGLQMDTSLL